MTPQVPGSPPEGSPPEGSPPDSPPAPGPVTGEGAPANPGEAFDQGVTGLVTKLFTFLATGAGAVTFVALTGAAITWVRFQFAQLPADQAVGLLPRDDLVNLGTIALLTFVILGLVAVAVVYAIDSPGRLTDRMRGGLCALVTAELIALIIMADYGGGTRKVLAGALMVILGFAGIVLLNRTKPVAQQGIFSGFRKDPVPVPPTTAELAAYEERARLDPSASPPVPKQRSDLTGKAIGAALGTMALTAVVLGLWFHALWVGAVAFLAGLLAAACLGLARVSGEKFAPYGIGVFFSVLVFGSVASTAEFAADPKVSPVALVRAGNGGQQGVVGLLIARTDDRYWLGHVTVLCEEASKKENMEFAGDNWVPGDEIETGSGRIFSIPRSQVLDDEIGTWTEAPKAGRRADELFEEMVKRQPPGGAQPPPEAKSTGNLLVPAAPPTTTTDTTKPGTTTTTTTTPQQPATATTPVKNPPINIKAPLAVGAVSYKKCTCGRPHIEKLEPAVARRGDPVKIIGGGLGKKAVVNVNGTPAKTGGWTSQRITFTAREAGDVEVNCGVESNKVPLKLRANARPEAAFSATPAQPGSRRFTLDSSASLDPDGDELKRRWIVNGRPMKSTKQVVNYRLRGKRAKVKLQVVDKFEKSASAAKTLRVDVIESTVSGDRLFDPDEYKIVDAGDLKKLRGQIKRRRSEIALVAIVGHADFTWTEAHNQTLSERRARAVLTYLTNGIALPRGAIKRATGRGEKDAKAKTLDSSKRAFDRRVDIKIVYSKSKSSASP